MRVFELALIIVNLIALILGPRNKSSKSILLGLTSLHLIALALHGAIEGFRYQMMFSYIFVVLFTIYALARAAFKFPESKILKILKGFAIVLSVLSLALTCLLAYALPVFKLPTLTGSYDVGVQYVDLTDEKRLEPFLQGSAKKRELAVKIYYPASKDKAKPYAAYFHDSPELIKTFTAAYGMPDFMFSHLRLVQTHTQEGLPVSDKQARYPVIFFSHGAGTNMEVHTSQCEDLASHGYIVVAVNHTYVSSATELPGGIVTDRDATVNFDQGDPREIVARIMADDVGSVIDKLVEMNTGTTDSIFAGKLDLGQIGVIGHSLGGAAAYDLALNDSRIKAVVNLDGSVYTVPKDKNRIAPFLMLANDETGVQMIQKHEASMKKWEDMPAEEQEAVASAYGSKENYIDIYKKQEQAAAGLAETLKASGSLYSIEGSAHMKFTDIGLFVGAGFHRFIGIQGSTSAAECLAITESVTLAFFNQHLKHETGDSPESVLRQYPKLHKVKLM